MVYLSVPKEQNPSGVAGGFDRMRDHKNGLARGVDLTEQVQQMI